MQFVPTREGFVSQRLDSLPTRPVAVGTRTAVLDSGDVLCTFMRTAALGTNDFVPVVCRSRDLGETWQDEHPIWPHLMAKWSIFASISRDVRGRLFLYGQRTPIDAPGEPVWSDATQGLKACELIWSMSADGGVTWRDPAVIPMPIPGSAEAPGAMCVLRSGRWAVCYAPYPTFDPSLKVDTAQAVFLYSDDEGATWTDNRMMRFAEERSGCGETWVVELDGDGLLLGTTWHMNQGSGEDYPNAYALSRDGGRSWLPTRSTGIMGQSTALAPFTGGQALFIYNQRRHGEVGVWLAVVRPKPESFGVEANQIIWRAQKATQSESSGELSGWTDFAFGEPAVSLLPDGTLLATLWCNQPSGAGAAYVKLAVK